MDTSAPNRPHYGFLCQDDGRPENAPHLKPVQSPHPQEHPLQPLVMPPWPSMLPAQPNPAYQAMYIPNAPGFGRLQPTPIATLVVADPSSSMHNTSTSRRILTDQDRKRMCQYAEDHPTSRQTEIGALFGVERRWSCSYQANSPQADNTSTVSKVLRQKEKYLFADGKGRSNGDVATPKHAREKVPNSIIQEPDEAGIAMVNILGTEVLQDTPTMLPSYEAVSQQLSYISPPAETIGLRTLPVNTGNQDGMNFTISTEEARNALVLVVNYFEQRPQNPLDLHESMILGNLIYRLYSAQDHDSDCIASHN